MEETDFQTEVKKGLRAMPKKLPSRYFYDDIGSVLFQEIMQLPEYYLSRSELGIFKTHKEDLRTLFAANGPFDIFELGAGDGIKTLVLLQHFVQEGAALRYYPIDISSGALGEITARMKKELPQLEVYPIQEEYVTALQQLKEGASRKKVVFFMGSNLGNFSGINARNFLQQLSGSMSKGDLLLLGVDLKKSPEVILPAYADAKGVTARFNLNLLTRINRELGGDFDLTAFRQYSNYEPETGEVRSYLLSLKAQTVHIAALGESFRFDAWETIHTEISKKYSPEELRQLCTDSGFSFVAAYSDPQQYFTDMVWEVV